MQVDFKKLDRAFNPRCVVVIGDSERGKFRWLRSQGKFKGKLYSVQVSPKSIEGIKAMGIENYTSLLDIPEPIDLAIVAVPRSVALKVLDDCIKKDVAVAHFFTAGFSETGTEEGAQLERLIQEKAKQANFHLVGPNCMGLFNPKAGIKQTLEQYDGSWGPVGFISQSGTHALSFSLEGHLQGMDICKSVSFGNGIVLDSADFLQYFGQDPEIKIIGMYLEGVKDGRKFFNVLKEVARIKPVVIWKGGRTDAGGRAIASHTGSLAVPQAIWDALVRQCGALKVDRVEELNDTIKALLYLSPVHGDRVCVAGGSGGQSVAVADTFAEAGLKIPRLTQESYTELGKFFNVIGGSYANPIDTGNPNREQMKQILEIVAKDANIDNLVLFITTRFVTMFSSNEQLTSDIDLMASLRQRSNKPMLAIVSFSTPREMDEARNITRRLQGVGVPAFPTMERAAFALKKSLEFYQQKSSIEANRSV